MGMKDTYLNNLRSRIPEVAPTDVAALLHSGAVLIDIREQDELSDVTPPEARHLSRSFLELQIETLVRAPDATILLLCAGGTRSLLAAENLRLLGYSGVRSVAGGFTRWKECGLPIHKPFRLEGDDKIRYSRQLK